MAELIDKNEILKKAVTIPGPSGKSVYSVVFTDDIINAKAIEPITENCIACKYDETEEKDGEHCKKCLAGDSQFELDKEFIESVTENDIRFNGVKDELNRVKNELDSTTKNDIAQERYQDLIEYFGGEDTVLKDRKEFKAWLERLRWNVKRADELARELGQLRPTTKDCLLVEQIVDKVIEKAMSIKPKDVIPQEPRCKECKWWKDSDGKYRRSCGAESQCPINTHAVYCGEGYCYMFSPKTDMSEVENDKRRTKKALPKTN